MQESYDEIIKLSICHALKEACRGDAICSGAQFVLAETPEYEPEAAQTLPTSERQN